MTNRPWHRAAAVVALLMVSVAAPGSAAPGSADAGDPPATPQAECGPGSNPETGRQGRVTADEVAGGRAAEGYTCNTELVGGFANGTMPGGSGGYKTFRYVDAAGRECAYYDTTLLFPLNAFASRTQLTGVYVLDMSDPAKPVHTTTLVTPAMQSPHETLSLNPRRGLLAASLANPIFYPGVIDIYDVSEDCRHPVLRSSLPVALLGHEGNFAPDGETFYVTSTGGRVVTAIDVSNPSAPRAIWTGEYNFHGLSVSEDGTRLYGADLGNPGLTILDVSQVQARVPDPEVTVVSHLTWDAVSIPQHTIPVTIGGAPYLIEIDEYSRGTSTAADAPVGAARIIDIADDTDPKVVSDLRLEVNQRANRAEQMNDPGASFELQGYAGHYCAVPQLEEPGIVACSFILSGMRVFDIRDPAAPKEIAYFNGPIPPTDATGRPGSAFAMSAPTFAPERGQIWYADGNTGFWAFRVTNGVWPFE